MGIWNVDQLLPHYTADILEDIHHNIRRHETRNLTKAYCVRKLCIASTFWCRKYLKFWYLLSAQKISLKHNAMKAQEEATVQLRVS
jgi:hypothetical protein